MTEQNTATQNDAINQLYQQTIIDHTKKPRNFGEMADATHHAEGFNPLCGDHYHVYLKLDDTAKTILNISFNGQGCAISKASSSMMTVQLKGKPVADAKLLFYEFQKMVKGELNPEKEPNHLAQLKVFTSLWKFPTRVKCAILSWHAVMAALSAGPAGEKKAVSTE